MLVASEIAAVQGRVVSEAGLERIRQLIAAHPGWSRRRRERRPPRHPVPPVLETETVALEPPRIPCPYCGSPPQRIGEEVTEEIDLIPAKLIRRRTVRPKYACRCGEAGVAIAPLPLRLSPNNA